jgi:diphthamide synthase (EF-2-diphthine--ammonia ligase)
MPRSKALISWSSGKDSAFALHEVRRTGEFEIVGVLTTVTETFGRVAIHGVLAEPMCSHRLRWRPASACSATAMPIAIW